MLRKAVDRLVFSCLGLLAGAALIPAPAAPPTVAVAPAPAPRAAAPLQFPPLSGDHVVIPLAIHDGDTIVFAWLVRDSARIFGINSPEVTGPQKPDGIKARDYLATLLPINRLAVVRVWGREKFGRCLLSAFTADGQDVSDLMVKGGYARAWDGQGPKP